MFQTRFGLFFGSFFVLFKPFFVSISKFFGGGFVLQTCRPEVFCMFHLTSVNPPGSHQFLKEQNSFLKPFLFLALLLESTRAETWEMRAVHGEKKDTFATNPAQIEK